MASYNLVDCAGLLPDVRIEWLGAQPLDESASYVFDFDTNICWSPAFLSQQTGLPEYNDTNVTLYTDCAECNKVCYRLIDCASEAPDALTDDVVMQDYVGQIITWKDDLDVIRCATVVTFLCREETFTNDDITIIGCFKNCTKCVESLEPVVIEEAPSEFVTIRRRVKPNFILAVCSLEKYKDTQCKFSEAVYQKMVSKRYGIDFCCEIDLDKYSTRSELMNLQILENTDWSDDTLARCTDAVGIGNMQINNDSCNVFKVYPEV